MPIRPSGACSRASVNWSPGAAVAGVAPARLIARPTTIAFHDNALIESSHRCDHGCCADARSSQGDSGICCQLPIAPGFMPPNGAGTADDRSEEHTSELQSLMRSSYAVFCLKKKHKKAITQISTINAYARTNTVLY